MIGSGGRSLNVLARCASVQSGTFHGSRDLAGNKARFLCSTFEAPGRDSVDHDVVLS